MSTEPSWAIGAVGWQDLTVQDAPCIRARAGAVCALYQPDATGR